MNKWTPGSLSPAEDEALIMSQQMPQQFMMEEDVDEQPFAGQPVPPEQIRTGELIYVPHACPNPHMDKHKKVQDCPFALSAVITLSDTEKRDVARLDASILELKDYIDTSISATVEIIELKIADLLAYIETKVDASLKEIQNNIDDFGARISNLEVEVSTGLENQTIWNTSQDVSIIDLSTDISVLKDDSQKQSAWNVRQDTSITELKYDVSLLKVQDTSIENAITLINASVNDLLAEDSSLERKAAEIDASIAELKNKDVSLDASIKNLDTSVQEIDAAIHEIDTSALAKIRRDINEIKDLDTIQNTSIGNHDTSIRNHESRISTAESNISSLFTTTLTQATQISNVSTVANEAVEHARIINGDNPHKTTSDKIAYKYVKGTEYIAKYWRTPTIAEFNYLLNRRSSNGYRLAFKCLIMLGSQGYQNGFIVLPDGATSLWNDNTASSWTSSSIPKFTESEWINFESQGAIFFPCGGYRYAMRTGEQCLSDVGNLACYWTATLSSASPRNAYDIWISSGSLLVRNTSNLNTGDATIVAYGGLSVRLIHDNLEGKFSISANLKIDIAPGNLQYHCVNKQWKFANSTFDYIGYGNNNVSTTYNGWIDVFNWGTSGFSPSVPTTYTCGQYDNTIFAPSRTSSGASLNNTVYDWGYNNALPVITDSAMISVKDKLDEIDTSITDVKEAAQIFRLTYDQKVSEIDSSITNVSTRLAVLHSDYDASVANINASISSVKQDINVINSSISNINSSVSDIAQDLSLFHDTYTIAVTNINTSINNVSSKLNDLSSNVNDAIQEINQSIADVSSRLTDTSIDIDRNLARIDSSLDKAFGNIDDISIKIPNAASVSNQLADKSFVNSTIQTATANFRGNWPTWHDVPQNSADYPEDYSGSTIPTTNDYLVVVDSSDYPTDGDVYLSGTWRFKYTSQWETSGKNGWMPEYQVNEEPFTSDLLMAINSKITELLTNQIKTNKSDILDLSTGKADKVNNANNGDLAGLDLYGNLTDSGYRFTPQGGATTPAPAYATVQQVQAIINDNVSQATTTYSSQEIDRKFESLRNMILAHFKK